MTVFAHCAQWFTMGEHANRRKGKEDTEDSEEFSVEIS